MCIHIIKFGSVINEMLEKSYVSPKPFIFMRDVGKMRNILYTKVMIAENIFKNLTDNMGNLGNASNFQRFLGIDRAPSFQSKRISNRSILNSIVLLAHRVGGTPEFSEFTFFR